MATRFYLPSSGTPPLSSLAELSNWGLPAAGGLQIGRMPMFTTKQNTALTTSQVTWPSATSQTWAWYQFQSDTLSQAYTFTTTDTFSAVIGKLAETTANGDTHLHCVVRVVSGDGTVVRGLLYNSNITNEWALMASAATRIASALAFTATVNGQTGDRIIFELGCRGVTPALELIQMRIGDPSATADFALTSGLTTDLCPWFEISNNVTFGSPPAELPHALPLTGVGA